MTDNYRSIDDILLDYEKNSDSVISDPIVAYELADSAARQAVKESLGQEMISAIKADHPELTEEEIVNDVIKQLRDIALDMNQQCLKKL